MVLAGGKSQRLGQDKRWLRFNGQPLLRHVVETLRPLVQEVIVVTQTPEELGDWGIRRVTDVYAGLGVLAGLHAGLAAATAASWALVVAADLPFLQPALLQALQARSTLSPADALVPRWRGYPEPLVALYRPATCAPAAERLLLDGRRRISDLYAVVQVEYFPEDEVVRWDPEGRSFFNVNTLSDWELAQALSQPK